MTEVVERALLKEKVDDRKAELPPPHERSQSLMALPCVLLEPAFCDSPSQSWGQSVAQAGTLGPCRFLPVLRVCRKYGGPIASDPGRCAWDRPRSSTLHTHAGQMHLAYVDYFAGTAMASALYAHQPEQAQSGCGTRGCATSGTAPSPAETRRGGNRQLRASDVAWVSGISCPLDTNLTVAATSWLGQSGLAERRSAFAQIDVSANYYPQGPSIASGSHVATMGRHAHCKLHRKQRTVCARHAALPDQGVSECSFRCSYTTYDEMQQWDLAPEGYYDDTIDPLTGDTLSSRHLGLWRPALAPPRHWDGFEHQRKSGLPVRLPPPAPPRIAPRQCSGNCRLCLGT